MSSSEKQIICRGCGEAIPADSDNCHHCGTSVRGNSGAILAAVVGSVLFLASIGNLIVNGEANLLLFGFIGLLVAAIGGYVIYEQRQRIVTPGESDTA